MILRSPTPILCFPAMTLCSPTSILQFGACRPTGRRSKTTSVPAVLQTAPSSATSTWCGHARPCRGYFGLESTPLGAHAVVQHPDDALDLIEQPRSAPRRRGSLMPVQAVFPYGGGRAPLYNPLRLEGLASLTPPPPRYYTAVEAPCLNPLWSLRLSPGRPGTETAPSS
jgi:hypothetical protein